MLTLLRPKRLLIEAVWSSCTLSRRHETSPKSFEKALNLKLQSSEFLTPPQPLLRLPLNLLLLLLLLLFACKGKNDLSIKGMKWIQQQDIATEFTCFLAEFNLNSLWVDLVLVHMKTSDLRENRNNKNENEKEKMSPSSGGFMCANSTHFEVPTWTSKHNPFMPRRGTFSAIHIIATIVKDNSPHLQGT